MRKMGLMRWLPAARALAIGLVTALVFAGRGWMKEELTGESKIALRRDSILNG